MKNQFRIVALGALMATAARCLPANASDAPAGDPYHLRVAHAADLGADEVLLTWTDAHAGKKAYKLYRQGSDSAWTDVATLPPGATEYQDGGLSATSKYSYRLVTSNHEMPESDVLTSKDEPQNVSMPLAGAKELVLLTTVSGDNDSNDHSAWCTPVLVKEDGTEVRLLQALKPTSSQVGWGKPEIGTISVTGTRYENSLMAHAASRIAFTLDGSYREFKSLVGVEPSQGETPGSVTFLAVAFPGSEGYCSEVNVTTIAAAVPNSFPQVKSPGNTVYYLDGEKGDDSSPGTAEDKPWKSLARLNSVVLTAGDKVLFKAGSAYTGCLKLQGSGKEGAPIIVDKYGEGPSPRINAKGKSPESLLLHNVEYYEVQNLELTNLGKNRARGRAGVRLRVDNFGTAHHIHLKKIYVHDVNGDLNKGDGDQFGGFGIQWVNKGQQKPSRFDDLLIEDCHLVRTDRNGICGASDFFDRTKWHPSLHVVIRRNLLEDIGGDGIVPIGCDGCLVEYNVLHGGRTRAPDKCAGIWPWSCDNTLLQFNEVSHMVGNQDGQGFDSDYNCSNTVFQYNYSHDNGGGFMLVCNNGGLRMPNSVGCTGTIIRYNISQNDMSRLFQFGGPCANTKIYNNVFYVGKKQKLLGVLKGDWGGVGKPEDVLFENNIFYVEGQVTDMIEAGKPPVFRNNVVFGNYKPVADGEKTIFADPMFLAPGTGSDGLKSLDGYKLKAGSPCIGAGVAVPDSGGRDFWGGKVPGGSPPAIGAHQP